MKCPKCQLDDQILSNPDPDSVILAKDLLVVLSPPVNLADYCNLFFNPKSEKPDESHLWNRYQHDSESQAHLP